MTFFDEKAAFLAMLPVLAARHPGQYVAVTGGEVVAAGSSRREVTQRFFERFDRGPVYIGFVASKRRIRQASPFRPRPNAGLS